MPLEHAKPYWPERATSEMRVTASAITGVLSLRDAAKHRASHRRVLRRRRA